jgi:hypothetical protein
MSRREAILATVCPAVFAVNLDGVHRRYYGLLAWRRRRTRPAGTPVYFGGGPCGSTAGS